ncbi:hypothetical protein [Vreelandella olivaria]|uniref:hypothetical protein n=1 Tax=Vreelandella olivaria TaxID=390919 RepID=UPI00201ED953|nr:hypothetical protein [Halomonas olivaria]
MTDRRDDDFRVRPSAPKNQGKGQGQSFVSKVLKQAGKASMHHSAAGGSGAPCLMKAWGFSQFRGNRWSSVEGQQIAATMHGSGVSWKLGRRGDP